MKLQLPVVRIGWFVFAVGLAGAALGQVPERALDQPREDGASRRRDDEAPPQPPPPKQKGKELFERDFPGPRDGRPGGDKNGPPRGKLGPDDRRPGEESPYEEAVRRQSEMTLYSHDRNRDGELDRSEWAHLRDAENLDTDHNGVITLKELMHGPHGNLNIVPLREQMMVPNAGGGFDIVPKGGFGGRRIQAGPIMPGMPSPFGEQGADDSEMRDLVKQDAEMDHKTHELSVRIRELRGDDRNKMKAELQELVNKHFDVRQKRRELQLKRMEDELARLREAISSRNKSRESIVANHMKELIGEERDLEF